MDKMDEIKIRIKYWLMSTKMPKFAKDDFNYFRL